MILKWGTTAAKSFKIQVSPDGSAWTDVFSTGIGSSYTVTDQTFPTTTARFVRMAATERAVVPVGGRRGNRNAATTQSTQPGATRPAATQPTTAPAPAGYMLFDFQVLKD
ncbi:MAG: discoidin domain-containing protein [Burkholderiales bacterium]|nr:discoidin domain-containing protein [Phycisphaerae bacterium]